MKKLITTLSLAGLTAVTFGQGTVQFNNTSTTLFQTNSIGIGGTSGNTSPAVAGGFYDALLTAASTVTTVDASLQQLLSSTWTFTGAYGTNTIATSGGRLNGGASAPTTTGWPTGVSNSFIVVAWSANLGTTWAQVAAELSGASLTNGVWSGGTLPQGGFLGASTIGNGVAGGGTAGLPAATIFGGVQASGALPVGSNTSMFVVSTSVIPEPSSFALAGLGAAAMLIFRRRK